MLKVTLILAAIAAAAYIGYLIDRAFDRVLGDGPPTATRRKSPPLAEGADIAPQHHAERAGPGL